jgi:hypothetical protein
MDPLRRRLREPEPVVPLAGAPAGSQAPNGSAPIRCCRLSRRSGLHLGAQGACGTAVFSDGTAPAPRSASFPLRAVVTQRPAPRPSRIELGFGAPHRFTGVTAGLIEDSRARPATDRGRRLLPEVAAARCVERERANPTCQRAPGHHGDVRAPGAPGSRGRRASRRSTRFSRSFRRRCRRSRPVPVRSGGLWRSGSSRAGGSCDRTMRELRARFGPNTRERSGSPQSSERLRSAGAPQRPAGAPTGAPRPDAVSLARELPPVRARSKYA